MTPAEAKEILQTLERRLRPAFAPFANDPKALADWVALLVKYDDEQVRQAFADYLDGNPEKWPNYYTFRELLKLHRKRTRTPRETCQDCGGGGWTPSNDVEVNGHTYSTAIPCKCPQGAVAERSKLYTEHAIKAKP